jgi:acyl carrier protein
VIRDRRRPVIIEPRHASEVGIMDDASERGATLAAAASRTSGGPPHDASGTDAIRAVVLRVLARIAPEVDPAAIRRDLPLRDQVDLDSMDFLNFVLGLAETLGIEVPERDYAALATLDGCVTYLAAHGARPR